MRLPLFAAVAAVGIVCSCATYDRDAGMSYEYDVHHPSQGDITRARRMLSNVAAASGVPRYYGGDYSPWPIAVYKGDDVFLHAVVEHGVLRIELARWHSPATVAFTRTKDVFDKAVAKTFGSRAAAQPPTASKIMYAY